MDSYNETYVKAQLEELVSFSQSKENIIYTIGMIYDHCINTKTSFDQVQFPCGMKLTFTYNDTYITPITIEIEPSRKSNKRILGGVVFPILSTTYTPGSKEKCLQYFDRVLR
jgi:hypothetical protein